MKQGPLHGVRHPEQPGSLRQAGHPAEPHLLVSGPGAREEVDIPSPSGAPGVWNP
jgi:hypothetical protein